MDCTDAKTSAFDIKQEWFLRGGRRDGRSVLIAQHVSNNYFVGDDRAPNSV
jgi:hypothetical protein